MSGVELTVGRAVTLAAERHPDRIAVYSDEAVLTHAELHALSNRIANGLRSLGLKKGDKVGIILPNSALYVALAYAIAKAGFVMMTLNYRFGSDEIHYQLSDGEANALVYHAGFEDKVDPVRKKMPALKTVVADDPSRADVPRVEELVAGASASLPPVDVAERDPFYLGYTSGTSGRPKGAIVSHRNRYILYLHMIAEYGFDYEGRGLHAGPFHHTAPFGISMAQLCLGGSISILPSFSAERAVQEIAERKITWTFMVPYMYNAIVSLPKADLDRYDRSSLKVMLSGGSALPTAVKLGILRTFPNAGLHEFYGATEAGSITNLRPEDQSRKTRSVGKPFIGSEFKIVREDGGEAPVNEVGEIYVKTASMFEGYYNDPEKTRQVLRDGWCALGDLGRRDEEGFLYIVDRAKDVIKSGGVNVYPSEIEEVLLMDPSVGDAAVIGVPSDQWGEAVHAILVPRSGAQIDEAQLLALCREKLAGYKVPKSIECRTDLPRSPAGKVLKRLLRDEFWAGSEVKV